MFEPARRVLGLLRELPLAAPPAAARLLLLLRARLREPPLPLGFLLLPPRQLLQFFRKLIDLFIAGLLLGLLLK